MKKALISIFLAFVLLSSNAGIAEAASLTPSQISAIVGLLRSFGADEGAIARVNAVLTGTSVPTDPEKPVITYCPTIKNTLYRGSSDSWTGGEVSMLQRFLRQLYPDLPVTGYFGVLTEAAVERFQSQYGISPVGIVGPETSKKIASLCGPVGYPIDPLPPVSAGYLQIEPSSASIAVGENKSLQAYYQPPMPPCPSGAFCAQVMPARIPVAAEWTSSNSSVASVLVREINCTSGVCPISVKGNSNGTADIKAAYRPSYGDGREIMMAAITVTARVTVGSGSSDPSITVFSPNGGEQFQLGSTQPITWSVGSFGRTYRISVVDKNGFGQGDVATVTGTAADKQVYYWNVGQVKVASDRGDLQQTLSAGEYKILIIEVETGSSDYSNAPFNIVAAGATVYESVKCVFNGSSSEQSCYTTTDTSSILRCSGVGACVVDLKGTKGDKITWKSSCGGYAYTVMDGTNEYAEFSCSSVTPSITVLSPNGGEKLEIGKFYTLSFAVKNAPAGSWVALTLQQNGVQLGYLTIGADPNTQNSISWGIDNYVSCCLGGPVVPIPPGDGYKVQALLYTGTKPTYPQGFVTNQQFYVSDTSDSPFSIVAGVQSSVKPMIFKDILKIESVIPYDVANLGFGVYQVSAQYNLGAYHQGKWYEGLNPGISGPVWVEFGWPNRPDTDVVLQDENGLSRKIYLPSVGANTASYGWYYWIAEDGASYYAHTSHGPGWPNLSSSEALRPEHLARKAGASVTPSITVLSPNGGESLALGTTQTIKWNSNSKYNLRIDLTDASNSIVYNIASNIPNTGAYNWVIPIDAGKLLGQHKILINTDPFDKSYSAQDSSDAPFSIVVAGTTVYESVKCVFNGSSSEQNCYTAADTSSIYYKLGCSGVGACVVDLKGTKGDKITWKSSCGGYAYTIMDGTNEYAEFSCSSVTPSITLIYPKDGYAWYLEDQNFEFRWSSSNFGSSPIWIYLQTSDGKYIPVAWSVPNTGSYILPKLTPLAGSAIQTFSSGSYKVVVCGQFQTVTSSTYSVCSNIANITISSRTAQTSLTVLSPNGGEKWVMGESQTVKWTGSNGTRVNITLLNIDKTKEVYGLAGSIVNDGSELIKVPYDLPAGQYYLRVSCVENCSPEASFDDSNAPFNIVALASTSVDLKVNGSDTPSAIPYGSVFTASWISTGATYCTGYGVDIVTVDGGVWTSGNYPASGSKTLYAKSSSGSVPFSSFHLGIQCWDSSGKSVTDLIENIPVSFVSTPSITVTYPNGEEALIKGHSYFIKWAQTGFASDGWIQLQLRDANNPSSMVKLIAASVPIGTYAGSFNWTVPIDIPDGKYLIWASAGSGSDALGTRVLGSDFSNAPFTISGTPGTADASSGGDSSLAALIFSLERQIEELRQILNSLLAP